MESLPRPNEPTPDEIRQRSEEIRATWTAAEEARRRGVFVTDGNNKAYEIPQRLRSHE